MDTLLVAPALPSPAPLSDHAAQGRLAALRTLHDALTTPEGRTSYDAAVQRVLTGPAPEGFKDAYAYTLTALARTLSD